MAQSPTPSLQEFAIQYLVDNGLWPHEAAAVVDEAMRSPLNAALAGRWNDAADGYPIEVKAALLLSLNHGTAKWLAENKPEHFARRHFEAKP